MLSQLFAWKVADLALIRNHEPLPYKGFWSFILFDVLTLRPFALVVPARPNASPTTPPVEHNPLLHCKARGSGGPELSAPNSGCYDQRICCGCSPRPSVGEFPASGSSGSLASSGPSSGPGVAGSTRGEDGLGDVSDRTCDLRQGLRADGGAGSVTEAGCGVPAVSGPGAGTGSADLPATSLGAQLRLTVGCIWGPLWDFALNYNACEAVNAYLMHRRAEDILGAPLLVQAWFSVCFASALYFHLTYFFHSMELLWVAGFALVAGLRAERWQPLFRSPERSTSPADFWNNRWHQAFRWWWTRLVFSPVRRGLRAALDRVAPPLERQQGEWHGKVDGLGVVTGGLKSQQRVDGKEERGAYLPATTSQDQRQQQLAGGIGSQPQMLHPGGIATAGGMVRRPQQRQHRVATAEGTGPESAGEDGAADATGTQPSGVRGRLRSWLRRHRGTLLLAVPTMAVFLFSALFHETLLWINFGRPTGEQATFFILHAVLLLGQRAAETAAPRLSRLLAARVPAAVRAAFFMGFMGLTSVIFFRPWFRSSYHRELRVLFYGPSGWVVRVWVLGIPPEEARLW